MAGTDDRLILQVHGLVQGVGFRWWARSRLADLDLTGSATNSDDGSVLVVARGPRRTLERLVREVRDGDAPGRVTGVTATWPDGDAGGDPRDSPTRGRHDGDGSGPR